MARYLVGRVAQAVLVLWAAFTVAFVILYLLPSDPLAIRLGANNVDIDSLSPDQLAAARAAYGLDKSPFQQYVTVLSHALRGDFGNSLVADQSVLSVIAQRLPGTLLLSGLAIAFAVVVGVGLAVLATYVQWGPARWLLTRLPAAGVSVPLFWVGLILIQVFAFTLGWFPAIGDGTPSTLVLPAVTMGLPTSAVIAQVLSRSFRDTFHEPYITTARAKGLSRAQLLFRHAFRNAALPTLTILGLIVGNTVSGAVVTETIFSRNGVGRLAQESVLNQDIPVVLGIVTLAAASFVVVNLLVDLIYPLLDPRIATTPKVA